MPLPIARQTNKQTMKLPNKKALLDCISIATLPEAARYFAQQYEKALEKAKKLPSGQNALNKVKNFAEQTEIQRNPRESKWLSASPKVKNDIQNYQSNLTAKVFNGIEIKNPVTLNFAVNDQSKIVRSLFIGSHRMDAHSEAAVDQLFNDFLADNNLYNENGVIYQRDDNGKIKTDGADNPVKADARELVHLLKEAFPAYAKTIKNLSVTSSEQPFPDQKEVPVVKPKTEITAEPAVAPVQPTAPTEEPEAPSAGRGM